MRLSRVQVRNYKSFRDSGRIELSPGFTVIVGKNDAGKTAFLEALGPAFNSVPHRSLLSVPESWMQPPPASEVDMDFELEARELRAIIQATNQSAWLPIGTLDPVHAAQAFTDLLDEPVTISTTFSGSEPARAVLVEFGDHSSDRSLFVEYKASTHDITPSVVQLAGVSPSQTIQWSIARTLRGRVFAFRAERVPVDTSPISTGVALAPNAGNLAQVLNYLQSSNPARYRRLIRYVSRVFPHIKEVTVPPQGNGARILLWSIDPETQRQDLAIPLSESGTGIGQVLAILYVVVVSDAPQVIVIDEPQSFLHPSAVRALLTILNENDRHQYILTTHSPVALASLSRANILMVQRTEEESRFTGIDADRIAHVRMVLDEVGVQLSDVWGADKVLWVEGGTEEACFPIIAQKLLRRSMAGVQVVGVRHTSDFSKRDARNTVELYRTLSSRSSLLPIAVGFILDSELWTDRDKEQITRRTSAALRFIPRRSYENYLLIPEAISEVLIALDTGADDKSPGAVHDWIAREGQNAVYHDGATSTEPVLTPAWKKSVNAARLLQDLFSQLSSTRVAYRKIEHGELLTEAVIGHAPEELSEVAGCIRDALASETT